MCNDIHFLARVDQMRWIGICEHDCIHLCWDHSVLFMHPNELSKLGWILDRNMVMQNASAYNQRPWLRGTGHTNHQPDRLLTVWIANKYAIVFQPVDFLLFGSLVSHALDEIDPYYLTQLSSIPIVIEEKSHSSSVHYPSSYSVQFSKN